MNTEEVNNVVDLLAAHAVDMHNLDVIILKEMEYIINMCQHGEPVQDTQH
jgi:hypothetical protein